MDSRVVDNEQPDGRGHVAHTRPHAQHGAGVVVRLESGAAFALHDDDGSIDNLVELGEVEPPSPPRKTLVPDPADIGRVREPGSSQSDQRVLALPGTGMRVVGHSIAESARSVHLAESVHSSDDRVGFRVVGKRLLESAEHGNAGDGRVDR